MTIRNKFFTPVFKNTPFFKSNFTKQLSLAILVLFVNSFAGNVKQIRRIPQLLFAFCILLLGTINTYGQSEITIGSRTSANYYPLPGFIEYFHNL